MCYLFNRKVTIAFQGTQYNLSPDHCWKGFHLLLLLLILHYCERNKSYFLACFLFCFSCQVIKMADISLFHFYLAQGHPRAAWLSGKFEWNRPCSMSNTLPIIPHLLSCPIYNGHYGIWSSHRISISASHNFVWFRKVAYSLWKKTFALCPPFCLPCCSTTMRCFINQYDF